MLSTKMVDYVIMIVN